MGGSSLKMEKYQLSISKNGGDTGNATLLSLTDGVQREREREFSVIDGLTDWFLRAGQPTVKCLNLRGCLCPKLAGM